MVVVFWLGSCSCLVCFLCSNIFISGIYYDTRREVFVSLKIYFIYWFCTGFNFLGLILFIVLWNIVHAAFLKLLASKQPPCAGVEAQ